jgi:UPF0042 nucleotide-binding protein
MNSSRFLIITGMSGAGKSYVLKVLEDLGFFCIDNLLPTLIPQFAELCQQMDAWNKNVALVVDIRLGALFEQLTTVLQGFANTGFKYDLLYLDCSDDRLIRRYKETRRRHPLAGAGRVSNGIAQERAALSQVRSMANYIVDTSDMTTAELKQYIMGTFFEGGAPGGVFNVSLVSFGFKYGIPTDADLVIDVRFLDHPFSVPELKKKNGNDQEIADFIMKSPVAREFLSKQGDLLDFLLPQFVKEGRTQLVVAVGCTGGMHRSVFIANMLASRIKGLGYRVRKEDRDLAKNIKPEIKL